MYELSHGSNPPKRRFEFLKFTPIAVSMFFLNSHAICFAMWGISFAIALYENSKVSEPKTGTTKIKATYSLNRAQLLCILRNAQRENK